MTIEFYGIRNKYGEFSNFSSYPIEIAAKVWPTNEHFFQSQKFITTEPQYAEQIRKSRKPIIAKKMGNNSLHKIREDWESVKDDIMRIAVYNKFTQHSFLKYLLISTRNQEIIEVSPRDYYWGIGANRRGKNMLGKIIMEIRDVLITTTEEDYYLGCIKRLNSKK